MQLLSGDVRYWLQILLIAGLAIAGWRWGGGPERALAALLGAMVLADGLNHVMFARSVGFLTIGFGHLAIDLAAALAATAVALFANRMYPLWFAAFQILALLAHLARGIAHGIAPLAFAIMYTGPSYFQIVLLAAGIWLHRRRVRKHGPYRSWRSFSHPSPVTMPRNWPNG